MEALGPEEVKRQKERERVRAYRAANKDEINRKARERRKDPEVKAKQLAATNRWRAQRPGYVGPTRQALVDHINSLKAAPCTDCGNCFPPECMDFDHVRGEKLFNVSHKLSRTPKLEVLLEEIDKCELVCANCHRIRTKRRSYENDLIHKSQLKGS